MSGWEVSCLILLLIYWQRDRLLRQRNPEKWAQVADERHRRMARGNRWLLISMLAITVGVLLLGWLMELWQR